MRTIEDWSINQHANILGFCDGSDIRTSRVIDRTGNVVKTVSGSQYRLGEPNLAFSKRRSLMVCFNVEDVLEAVDVQIERTTP